MRRITLTTVIALLLLSVGMTFAQETTPEAPAQENVGFIVAQVLPADGSAGIDPAATITVIFNRPVVPLGIAEDAGTLPQPLTFSPAVEGQGEWLNTSIYTFEADPALAGGTEYTVSVDPALVAADGTTLAQPFTWSFSTAAPILSSVAPEDGNTDVRLGRAIEVRFNQPMDQANTEANFSLHPAESDESVSGSFAWADDGAGFLFVPEDDLQIATTYTAEFAEPPLPAGGGAPLEGQMSWSFSTVPLPAVVRTDPFDRQQNAYAGSGFTIYFASPMNPDTLDDAITIEPEPFFAFDNYYSDYNNSYTISFSSEPSTDYTITLGAGMEDIYGNPITTEKVVQYTTAPYDPDVSLQAPGDIGFYNAAGDQTQLFLTHRNVSEIDLSLYSVQLDDFIAVTTGDNYYNAANQIPTGVSNLLRRWTIPSVAPLNARRYELLNLGDTGVDCPGALESHLYPGADAIVVSEPDPVRARASAPDGEILDVLYKDYALTVVGGPICANSILWWEVSLRDGESAWVAEGVADGTENERFLDLRAPEQRTPVPLTQENGDALIPGIYFLRANAPELERINLQARQHILVVANANVTLKTSMDSALVWATDVQTGEPIPDAPVQLYNRFHDVVAEGTTDADGLVRLEFERLPNLDESLVAVLQSDDYFGIGITRWSDGIDAYYFGLPANYYPEQYRVYLYTERPIYRPDQPVYFRGIVRAQDDVTYTVPSFDTISLRIIDDQFEVVYEEDLPLTEFGSFSASFELAADAPLGSYRIVAQLPGQNPDNFYPSTGSVGFDVAEYRAPEFQVNVTAQTPEVVQGDTVNVAVDSTYFFGGAVANADVTYSVSARPYAFEYEGSGYYSFSDFNADADPGEFFSPNGGLITEGEGKTDASGHFLISFPADLQDATMSQTFTVEAAVTDESDQVVAGRTDVIVHQGLLYVGVQPEEYVATAGDETNVNLIAVDWESEPIPDQTLEIEVVERRWSSVQEQDERGRTVWTYEVEEIPVSSGEVTTDADGEAVYTFTPESGGIFKITAITRDERGNEIRASNTVWVSSREYVSWRQQNSNRIDLVANAQDYEVGDTAEILITSPFQGATEALVTVERGDVLYTERITMDSNSFVYNLPVTEDFAPNVFVSVVLVKGVDETNPVAAFRMGLVQLNVNNERKAITLEISTDVEQAGPGDTVEYTVQATNFEGEPVVAEVGVSLTDLAVLTIGDPNSGPILDYYYGQQGLSVRTSTPLTINVDQITQTVIDTIKGGGGGFGEGGIFDIRQEFVDTPYWNATLTTNEDGVATFSVTLPDNLTTWRLDARAVTDGADGETLVGQATSDLLSTKPLLIRPVTPRFFVVADEVVIGAVVNNNSPSDLDVDVTLQAAGVSFTDDATQTFSIPAGQSTRVNWRVTVEDVSSIDLTFIADGGDQFNDASKPPLGEGDDRLLPVYRYEAPETVGTGGLLREAGDVTEGISLPQDMEVSQGELTVRLDPSLAATTLDSLDYLETYPYQSIESIISRFLPNIMTYRALESLGLDDADLRRQLEFNVTDAIQQLYAQQKVNGGWGWYVQDSSNPLVTAYALIGLSEAQEQGFNVSDTVLSKARTYLRGTFITPGLDVETWRLNRQAFVLYALARSGDPDVARTTTLYESRDRLSYYARGFLAQTLHIINPDDTSRTDVLLSDLLNGAVTSATGVHWNEESHDYWNWNTDTRTTAVALETFIQLQPENNLIPNIVRYLITQRQADAWETTQETAWAVMSLTDWMLVSGELNPDYTYSAEFNGESLTEGAATPETVRESVELQVRVSEMLADQVNNLVISRGDGAGVLYYTAHLRIFLPVPEIEPLDRGIIIERHYTQPGGDEPVTSATVGDNLEVHLTVIVPNDLHYVVIEDPIPAGTDAVNPNLATSQQIGTQPELNLEDPLTYGWGWWYFSNIEFRDEKVVLSSTYLPAGTYEYVYTIRAGLAGEYNVIPATGGEAYFPEVYGRSAGLLFTIAPEAE